MHNIRQHSGSYSDIVTAIKRQGPLYSLAYPGKETQEKVQQVLGCYHSHTTPFDGQVEKRWQQDELDGELLSWSVGYESRTQTWVLKPKGLERPLPAVLALPDHRGFKYTMIKNKLSGFIF
jgi:hypothetical protein